MKTSLSISMSDILVTFRDIKYRYWFVYIYMWTDRYIYIYICQTFSYHIALPGRDIDVDENVDIDVRSFDNILRYRPIYIYIYMYKLLIMHSVISLLKSIHIYILFVDNTLHIMLYIYFSVYPSQ